MKINADFTIPALKHFAEDAWQPSPSRGVERIMLDRIGEEVARATSIVRYAPGSRFPRHVHGGGEEFFVLDGVFSDENGDYPAGTYVRNPIGTAHTPFSAEGCIIWVKLWQFQPDDTVPVVADTSFTETDVMRRRDLHAYGTERVYVQSLPAGARHTLQSGMGGAEALVLGGSIRIADITLTRWSWYRGPKGADVTPMAGGQGATLLVKEGHLTATTVAAPDPAPAT